MRLKGLISTVISLSVITGMVTVVNADTVEITADNVKTQLNSNCWNFYTDGNGSAQRVDGVVEITADNVDKGNRTLLSYISDSIDNSIGKVYMYEFDYKTTSENTNNAYASQLNPVVVDDVTYEDSCFSDWVRPVRDKIVTADEQASLSVVIDNVNGREYYYKKNTDDVYELKFTEKIAVSNGIAFRPGRGKTDTISNFYEKELTLPSFTSVPECIGINTTNDQGKYTNTFNVSAMLGEEQVSKFEVTSAKESVATAAADGSNITVTGVATGQTEITITAIGSDPRQRTMKVIPVYVDNTSEPLQDFPDKKWQFIPGKYGLLYTNDTEKTIIANGPNATTNLGYLSCNQADATDRIFRYTFEYMTKGDTSNASSSIAVSAADTIPDVQNSTTGQIKPVSENIAAVDTSTEITVVVDNKNHKVTYNNKEISLGSENIANGILFNPAKDGTNVIKNFTAKELFEPAISAPDTVYPVRETPMTVDLSDSVGTLTCTSERPDIAEAAINGSSLTITGKAIGETTITVTAAGDPYFTPATKTITVKVGMNQTDLITSKGNSWQYNPGKSGYLTENNGELILNSPSASNSAYLSYISGNPEQVANKVYRYDFTYSTTSSNVTTNAASQISTATAELVTSFENFDSAVFFRPVANGMTTANTSVNMTVIMDNITGTVSFYKKENGGYSLIKSYAMANKPNTGIIFRPGRWQTDKISNFTATEITMPTLSISEDMVELVSGGSDTEITVNATGTNTTAQSSDTSVAEASIADNKLTISPKGIGAAVITVTTSNGGFYNNISKEIMVYVGQEADWQRDVVDTDGDAENNNASWWDSSITLPSNAGLSYKSIEAKAIGTDNSVARSEMISSMPTITGGLSLYVTIAVNKEQKDISNVVVMLK